ncbi:MAG: hypothetical protein ACXVDN_19320, partial [Ktedonobacteraceae bacterium]
MSKNTVAPSEKQTAEHETTTVSASLARSGNQNNLRNIGLIIAREFKNRVTQRSFKISTAIILVLIVIGSFVPTIVAYISSVSNSQTKVVVVNNAGTIAGMNNVGLQQYFKASLNGTTTGQSTSTKPAYSINTMTTDATSNLQKQVKDGSTGVLLVLNRLPGQDVQFTYYTNSNPVGDSNVSNVQGAASQLSILDRASRLGLTPDQTSKLF